MYYKSTRNSTLNLQSAQAITTGISPEGGLFVPESLPMLAKADIEGLVNLSYADRAKYVFSLFLTDFSREEITHCVDSAYNDTSFDSDGIAQIARISDDTYMLELWHGPTCAFKDMALQILPYLMTASAEKCGDNKRICILVATSGDTGKAALEGFKDVDGTSILVFYPEDGVSDIQKRQMTTQEGENVGVCAIKGNFDDAQSGVKAIFADSELAKRLSNKNVMLSSANSINWGRLAPQIIYYISTYAELIAQGEITMGEQINFAVPTGNFGNILAAYYAKKMGLPIAKLICASNANNILTDFITTGIYDRNRSFHTTISPSMDILISSNLERLLYDLCGNDDAQIRSWFESLSNSGKYEVSQSVKDGLKEHFVAGYCSDNDTKSTIKNIFDKYGYLCDTHTAVAVKVYEEYKQATGDKTKTVVVSTASPYKFAPSVLEALKGKSDNSADEFELLERLESASLTQAPIQLKGLKGREVRFSTTIDKNEMKAHIEKAIDNI